LLSPQSAQGPSTASVCPRRRASGSRALGQVHTEVRLELTKGDADLLSRLATDKRVGLSKETLVTILAESARFVGAAPQQVDTFVATVKPLAKRLKGAADYRPAKLL
jgi:hypothetical protein